MATYQDFSLIKKEVDFIKDRNGIERTSTAFIFMVLEKFYPEIEPNDYIIDGSGDLSIDAYYIDRKQKIINIFQFKYTEDFEKSKNKNAIKESDLNDLTVRLTNIWDKNEEYIKQGNKHAIDAIKEIWEAFEEGYIKTNIYFISNYQQTINIDDKRDAAKAFRSKFKAKLEEISIDRLIELFIKKEFLPISIDLQLKGKNYFEESTGNVRALITEVNAWNFLKAILVDESSINENVFDENVRVYLHTYTKINKQIFASIKDEDNYKFFYYNNGITAICDKFEHNCTDSPIVHLENFQIVNGSQTMHTIYEAYKKGLYEKINNIYLLLRIYEVRSNREIGQEIARYTNTQNPVRNRDIMSNDPTQKKLQKELFRENYLYESKKYEYRDSNQEYERIDAEKVGQSMLSFYLEKPGSAKNKKQEIFGDFYNDIFNEESINADKVLLSYTLLKKIEKDVKRYQLEIRELESSNKEDVLRDKIASDDFLNYASYYLLFTLGALAKINSITLEKANLDKIFNNYSIAKDILRTIIRSEITKPKFSLTYLFKSDDLVDKIKQALTN